MTERRPFEAYYTPATPVRAILPVLEPWLRTDGWVHEPACGDGAIVTELLAAGVQPWRILATDIRPEAVEQCRDRTGVHCQVRDYLAPSPRLLDRPIAVVTNPPYSRKGRRKGEEGLAADFVRRALLEVAPGGVVAMLLRLAFAASQARAELHRAHPSEMHVLSERPSYTGDGNTDMTDYAWFVWHRGVRQGLWQVL